MANTSSLEKNRLGSKQPSPHQIATLAFHLYLSEGCPDGSELEIWLRAEQMLADQIQRRDFVDFFSKSRSPRSNRTPRLAPSRLPVLV